MQQTGDPCEIWLYDLYAEPRCNISYFMKNDDDCLDMIREDIYGFITLNYSNATRVISEEIDIDGFYEFHYIMLSWGPEYLYMDCQHDRKYYLIITLSFWSFEEELPLKYEIEFSFDYGKTKYQTQNVSLEKLLGIIDELFDTKFNIDEQEWINKYRFVLET